MAVKKILFAEHETLIVEVLSPILRSKGYHISAASDSDSVMRLLSLDHPDLLVIDASLPGSQDGLSLCKALKNDFMTTHIPLIVLIDKRQLRKRMLEIEHGIDDYLITPPDPIDLEIRIEMALRRTEHQVRANALTKLPGSREIERIIKERMMTAAFSFAYIDIDHFKAFNDAYGYVRGDAVIIQLAHIISTITKQLGNPRDFVGHVGGDDFVVITTPDKEMLLAARIIAEFDRLAVFHYNQEDRKRGYLIAPDRAGIVKNIPLMSISIAVVNNKHRHIHTLIELTEVAFEIKSYLKTLPGSNFLVNRRVVKHAVPRVHSGIATTSPEIAAQPLHQAKPVLFSDKPLGQLLLERGLITEEQLYEALRHHWLSAQRLGNIVVGMGLVKQEDIEKALAAKQNNTTVHHAAKL